MKAKVQEILKAPYSRVLIPDEDGFSAEILEFPGCFAQGDTPNEAFDNLGEAAKAWVEAMLEQGQEIPSPTLNQGYSGKIALRIPRSLHKRAAQFAERDGTSLNQFLISSIASKVGAEEYHSFLFRKIEAYFVNTITNFTQTITNNVMVWQHPQINIGYNPNVNTISWITPEKGALNHGRSAKLNIQS